MGFCSNLYEQRKWKHLKNGVMALQKTEHWYHCYAQGKHLELTIVRAQKKKKKKHRSYLNKEIN